MNSLTHDPDDYFAEAKKPHPVVPELADYGIIMIALSLIVVLVRRYYVRKAKI